MIINSIFVLDKFNHTMNITIVAGARPNFMKIAPIIRAIEKAKNEGKSVNYRLIYTGKENDPAIDASLFTDLDIKPPHAYLNVQSKYFVELAAGILTSFDKELIEYPTDVVLVVDDLTATMSCAIVAKKRGIKVAHLVAGTRSFDLNMPKEINRLITDGLSDYLFTAGSDANRNLNQTGTSSANVFHVGNILIDTIRYNRNRLNQPAWFDVLELKEKNYILLTLNRHSLIDNKENFKELIDTILENNNGLPIIAPVRPYIEKRIEQLEIDNAKLHIMPSQNYLNFGYLVENAKAIVTDSGNIAEEATFLGVPCISLNSYAEHPETWRMGTNILVGEDAKQLKEALNKLHKEEWQEGSLPERWDGRTAERIIQTLVEEH